VYQPNLCYLHRSIYRFRHVINGQSGDGNGRQGLHFNSRLASQPNSGLNIYPAFGRVGPAGNVNMA
jgi:hypothetical protein